MGLIIAQAVGTLQVWQSNHLLHDKMQAVLAVGFLAVPNAHVLPSLETALAAICGGLFFTLSLGAGITLASMALAWLLPPDTRVDRLRYYIPLVLWAIILTLINVDGVDLYVNLYFIFIPPLVFLANRRGFKKTSLRKGILRLLPVIILALLWFSQFDAQMFIDIRDRLLLSNPVGQRINDFYYRYTLYPAEVFKPLSQKTIRTASVDLISDPVHRKTISQILIGLDWLPVSNSRLAELVIREKDARLILSKNDRTYVTSSFSEMSSRPEAVLKEFSEKEDRYPLFRQLTYYGILFAFPILLYIGLYTVMRWLLRIVASPQSAATAASAACLLLGVAVWIYFQQGRTELFTPNELPGALSSDHWQTQVAALRQCRRGDIDVFALPSYEALKTSSNTAVRYWLVETLVASKQKDTARELIGFLNDPSINVRTRACEILAQRNVRSAVETLLMRLTASDNWYFQWYAYKALKALGWKQSQSA